ncbi:GNAT family N-acetyltransferase [Agromyces atrinae]|uniref:GNAT family N-acetyltransferase n=1 Tax=Agromyces atrinae TaxID=592376 RepID=A0A4Q2M127_9MICO|nr:GNAT family N-acetyltransferase [Agromyces atrinae]NYD66963.1 ribosomal protein S18 acetylase RimI-like enzyme [Agromyces atrinae]RXZ85409.1 GNAT family N-acetyltransferase [Agromyces atrinae]
MTLRLRPFQPADLDGIADVCVRTGAAGEDARGLYSDDSILGDVYATPYAVFDPDLAFVVTDGHRVQGYVLAVADTARFAEWFRAEWMPLFDARHGVDVDRGWSPDEVSLREEAHHPERMLIAELDEYPAHLHIDLLPEAQGHGLGRRLIDLERAALRGRGVSAVHLGLDPANTRARTFYEHLGFHELASSTPDEPLFGIATS